MRFLAQQLPISRVFQSDSFKRNSLDVMQLQIRIQAVVVVTTGCEEAVRATLQSAKKTSCLRRTGPIRTQSIFILCKNEQTPSLTPALSKKLSSLRGRAKMRTLTSKAQLSPIIPDSLEKQMKLR
jgi:hypothetical protein